MKTALVHDYLAQAGGAERVAASLHDLFPDAPFYTSVYDPRSTLREFENADIRTSRLQRWPFSSSKFHKLALPYYPAAFEQFDLTGFDLVLSSSSSFAKGVITGAETCHVCYCHTPSRFIWRQREYLRQSPSATLTGVVLKRLLHRLRSWDVESAQRVDFFIANSYNVARRIQKWYRRDVAAVVHPPVDTNAFSPAEPEEVGDDFLVVSRLLSYKRIDLAIEACNRLRAQLRIVGAGPDLARLRRIAGPTVRFLGRVSDADVKREMARCRALIFPGEEDFGLTPVECMASGRPVVAFGLGGALETVIDGRTGVFFREQSVDSLCDALLEMQRRDFSPNALRLHAAQFDKSVFSSRMLTLIDGLVAEHRRRNSSIAIDQKGFTSGFPAASRLTPQPISGVSTTITV